MCKGCEGRPITSCAFICDSDNNYMIYSDDDDDNDDDDGGDCYDDR